MYVCPQFIQNRLSETTLFYLDFVNKLTQIGSYHPDTIFLQYKTHVKVQLITWLCKKYVPKITVPAMKCFIEGYE